MADSTQSKTPILGKALATQAQMSSYLRKINDQAPDYSQLYLDIGAKYGVRGDFAFAQSVLETGVWRFGGSVRPEQNNFAGFKAVNSPGGASFATPAQGIEAQIQHLYGYATSESLPQGTTVVDPRFKALEQSGLRGSAPNWEDLNGKWAVPGTDYGQNIVYLMNRILAMKDTPVSAPTDWKSEAMAWLRAENLIVSAHEPHSPVTWAEFGTVLRKLHEKLLNEINKP